MFIGCLDTSTNYASFALYEDEKLLLFVTKECKKSASKLLPWISAQIRETGVDIAGICQWRVGKGPGSFTGTRVGIAFVKGLCFASGAVYHGVNSGYGLLYSYLAQNPSVERVSVLHDGRRQEVICNTFDFINKQWVEAGIEVVKIRCLPDVGHLKGRYISNMPAAAFPENMQNNIHCIDKLQAKYFRNLNLKEICNAGEMDLSCEPIYVRPPVFMTPK